MKSFLTELARRRVWLFGGIYLALGWVLLQVAIAVETTLSLPGWVDQITLVLLGLGFPVALLLAWAQESTPGDRGGEGSSNQSSDSAGADEKGPPSIAVLPFDNLSDDPDQAYFADGMTEDLIRMLASISQLSVTARNSTFAYKGTSPDIREVGEKLNVNYVVEGSIRRVGDNVRVTAQLNETATGTHVWAEKYDRPSSQLYDIQDEVIESVCNQVGDAVIAREFQLSRRTRVENMDAWALFMRAESMRAEQSVERLEEQEELLRAALRLEPGFAMALASLGTVQSLYWVFGLSDGSIEQNQLATETINAAVSLAPNDQFVLERAVIASYDIGNHDDTIRFASRGIEVAPAQAAFWSYRGMSRAISGDVEGGEKDAQRGLELGKNHQLRHYLLMNLAYVRFAQDRFEEMEDLLREGLSRHKDEWLLVHLIVAQVKQGKIDSARDSCRSLQDRRSDWKAAEIRKINLAFGLPPAHVETFSECLKLAGLE